MRTWRAAVFAIGAVLGNTATRGPLRAQDIPVLPLCHPSELPPAMSLTAAEFESLKALLDAAPVRTVTIDKATAVLRAAVRETGPQIQGVKR